MSERREHLFSVLRHPAFRWIWIASFVSNVGNWMEAVGQGWLVQQQTNSPFFVELLAAQPAHSIGLAEQHRGAFSILI